MCAGAGAVRDGTKEGQVELWTLSSFSQKSPNKKHLSLSRLPGHDVRHPFMILVGNVNDSCIIHR